MCIRDSLNRAARRVGNQAAHTGKLPQLTIGTTGAGIDHHIDRVIVVKAVSYTHLAGADDRIRNGFRNLSVVAGLHHILAATPVSYTHLDVYKRQLLLHFTGRVERLDAGENSPLHPRDEYHREFQAFGGVQRLSLIHIFSLHKADHFQFMTELSSPYLYNSSIN